MSLRSSDYVSGYNIYNMLYIIYHTTLDMVRWDYNHFHTLYLFCVGGLWIVETWLLGQSILFDSMKKLPNLILIGVLITRAKQ